jgi:VanZ family protein
MIPTKRSKWRASVYAYAPLILWIGLVFFLSTGQGAASETSRIIRPILEFLFPLASEETLRAYHGYIRKTAHFAEYAVMAFLAVRAFSRSSVARLRTRPLPWAFVLVLPVAAADELNQSFLASRTGSFWDVLLDAAGGAAMIAVIWMIRKRRRAEPR